MSHRSLVFRLFALMLSLGAGAGAAEGQRAAGGGGVEEVQEAMAAAAVEFLTTVTGARRALAHYPFDDEVRRQWAYVPGPRAGLPLAEMTAPQRMATHALLQVALSGSGYLKVTSIMQLEEVLRGIETQGFPRSVEGYTLAIFGDPSPEEPWGWRFEGHHVSLNFTSVEPDALATTPLFLGSNPAEVRGGSWTGLRVLREEEDVARHLLMSLSETQRARAIYTDVAPIDIVTRNDPVAREVPREGLPAREMGAESRMLLLRLLEVYASTLEPRVAEARLAAVRAAGIDELSFAWAGSPLRGEPHYYRIHGPTLLIEYDNVQNDANHIHTVWRDLENDFGGDLLREHYRSSPHHAP